MDPAYFAATHRMIDIRTRTHALSADIKHPRVKDAMPGPSEDVLRLEPDFVGDMVRVKLRARNGGASGRVGRGRV